MWSKAEFVEGVTFCQDHRKITVETHVHSVQTECNRCTNISLVAREPRSQTGSVCRPQQPEEHRATARPRSLRLLPQEHPNVWKTDLLMLFFFFLKIFFSSTSSKLILVSLSLALQSLQFSIN